MSIQGPGGGFINPGRFNQAANSSGVNKPAETSKKPAASSAAPASNSSLTSFNNILGAADVAPPPTFHEVTQQVVSNVAKRDPFESLDDLKNPELKQALQLGYLPVTAVS